MSKVLQMRLTVTLISGEKFDTGPCEYTLEDLLADDDTHGLDGEPVVTLEEAVKIFDTLKDHWVDFDTVTIDDQVEGSLTIKTSQVAYVGGYCRLVEVDSL